LAKPSFPHRPMFASMPLVARKQFCRRCACLSLEATYLKLQASLRNTRLQNLGRRFRGSCLHMILLAADQSNSTFFSARIFRRANVMFPPGNTGGSSSAWPLAKDSQSRAFELARSGDADPSASDAALSRPHYEIFGISQAPLANSSAMTVVWRCAKTAHSWAAPCQHWARGDASSGCIAVDNQNSLKGQPDPDAWGARIGQSTAAP
jgi:hypothetical protein